MDQDTVSLGEIRHTFRPKLSNVCAGTVLGLVMLVGGFVLAVYFARQPDPRGTGDRVAKYAITGVFALAVPIGGIALLAWMKRLASHRVTVHDKGFSFGYAGSTEICPWTELAKINEVFTEEQMKVLKVPGATIKNTDRSFVLHRRDGKEFRFHVNSIDNIPRLAECLKEVSDKYGIAWEQIQQ